MVAEWPSIHPQFALPNAVLPPFQTARSWRRFLLVVTAIECYELALLRAPFLVTVYPATLTNVLAMKNVQPLRLLLGRSNAYSSIIHSSLHCLQ